MNESKYLLESNVDHRKTYGQFFTPPSVAHFMAKWVAKDHPESVLDPAFGLGVFYDEIKKLRLDKKLRFVGYEIDDYILKYLKSNHSKEDLEIINSDYLGSDILGFDGIICNPPYMRFQKFLNRHDVLPKIEKQIGKRLTGYSNIASVFLVKALKCLKSNGRLAFIMPFEFFNTGYGKEVKKSLLENNLLKQIIIFSNEKEIFPDATTTVSILLCKNDKKQEPIKITQIVKKDELEKISDISNFYQKKINLSDLPYNKKWTPIILSLFSKQKVPADFCGISFYGSFIRGIATGANDFFALKKSDIKTLGIDKKNRCKCVTKSQQIQETVFTDDVFLRLYDSDKPVHCLDVTEHEDYNILCYIKKGEDFGYHQRYLTKNRKPWYKIEHRKPAQILFGVFSRGRLKVIRNYTDAVNFTCFHSFFPNIFGMQIVDKLFVYLLSDIGQEIIKINKRSYGDNLDKFEPNDINNCLCPNQSQFAEMNDMEVIKVIEMAKTDEKVAIEMSNKLVDKIINVGQDHITEVQGYYLPDEAVAITV